MAEAPDLERSLWEVQDDDDEEITLMVRKTKYEELPRKEGRSILSHTQ